MMRPLAVALVLAGFVLAIAGVPAFVFVTAWVMLTVGFVAGYIAAHRELVFSEEDEFERMRRLYPGAAAAAHDEIVAELKAGELKFGGRS